MSLRQLSGTSHICHSEQVRPAFDGRDAVKNLPDWYAELTDDMMNLDVDSLDVRYSAVIQTSPFDFVRLLTDRTSPRVTEAGMRRGRLWRNLRQRRRLPGLPQDGRWVVNV